MIVICDVPIRPARLLAVSRGNTASGDVSDFTPGQVERAEAEAARKPLPAQPSASRSAPTMALAEGEGIPVPSFAGKTVRSVTEECLRLGLAPLLVGTGVAVEQAPAPGELVRQGSRVTVRFARSPALVARSTGRN